MHYLLFLPGCETKMPTAFVNAGLSGLWHADGPAPLWFDATNYWPGSSDGVKQGLFATFGETLDATPGLGYLPESQDWFPCPGDKAKGIEPGRYWMGRQRDVPVKPSDLQRKVTLPGSDAVLMSDGQEWLLPIGLRLPHVFGQSPDGSLTQKPAAKYAAIYEVCKAASAFRWDNDLPWIDACTFVAEMLAHNYRITKEIAIWLGLFGTDTTIAAYDHCSGDTLLKELKKKTDTNAAATTT